MERAAQTTCNMRRATCDMQHATHNMAGAREALQGRGSHVAITGASYGAHMPCGLQSVRLGADSPAVEGVHGAGMLCERKCDGRNQPRLLLLVMLPDLRTARHDAMCNAQHATCTRQQPCNVQHRAFSSFFHAAACHATPPHPTPPHANPRRTPARRGAHSIPARKRAVAICLRAFHSSAITTRRRAAAGRFPRCVPVHRPSPSWNGRSATGLSGAHACCTLSVARCPLHVARCTYSVALCPLHVIRCTLARRREVQLTKRGTAVPLFVVLLRVVGCTLRVVRCTLHVVCRTLSVARCLSRVVC